MMPPQACLADVLARIAEISMPKVEKLLPGNRGPATSVGGSELYGYC